MRGKRASGCRCKGGSHCAPSTSALYFVVSLHKPPDLKQRCACFGCDTLPSFARYWSQLVRLFVHATHSLGCLRPLDREKGWKELAGERQREKLN